MKFLELNKKRQAIRSFNDKPVDLSDVRTAIEIATLAPSAFNIQPWKFVIVKEKKNKLADIMFGRNIKQIEEAQCAIVIFSDTDLSKRARKIARFAVNKISDEQLGNYATVYPKMFEKYDEKTKGEFLSFNIGLVTMNLALALTDQGIGSNILMGFDKEKTNDVLGIDPRFKPEIILSVGYTDEKTKANFRIPVDELIEKR